MISPVLSAIGSLHKPVDGLVFRKGNNWPQGDARPFPQMFRLELKQSLHSALHEYPFYRGVNTFSAMQLWLRFLIYG